MPQIISCLFYIPKNILNFELIFVCGVQDKHQPVQILDIYFKFVCINVCSNITQRHISYEVLTQTNEKWNLH
jgi:hypothetical protein